MSSPLPNGNGKSDSLHTLKDGLKSPKARRQRLRIYTLEDVCNHRNANSCWIVRNELIYDITNFLNDHPGGDDIILEWAGKDIGDVMSNGEHQHSDAAFEMMSEYLVGRIGTDAGVVDEGS